MIFFFKEERKGSQARNLNSMDLHWGREAVVTLLAWKHMWSSCEFKANCSLTKCNLTNCLLLLELGLWVTFSVEIFLNDTVIQKVLADWVNIVIREQLAESKRKVFCPSLC